MPRILHPSAGALLATLALVAGGDDAQGQGAGLALRQVGTFAQPVQIAHVPGLPRMLYVVERAGTISVVRRGRKLARPFLNIRGRVRSEGSEEGLLSVAFHPRYPRNRSFFVYYVDTGGDIRVERYRSRPGRPARANPRSGRTVIAIPHPVFSNHNGGQLRFGPGGLLFIGTGDGGGSGDPHGNAQDPRSLLGKLLRVRPKPRGGHAVPRGNPLVGRPGRGQIYSLGLRNPWRFSLDRRTGDLLIADVGQGRWEEINRTTLEQARGANFGWNCFEGDERFASPSERCAGIERSELTFPIHAYPIAGRRECAIIGGYVARGRAAPKALRGRYVYGDFCTGEIRSLLPHARDPSASDRATGLELGRLSSFGQGRRGALYAASLEGPVHRIISR